MANDYPSIVRLIRIVAVFIKNFSGILITECEVFISRLIKMLDPHTPLWNQVIALEVFKGFCENHAVIRYEIPPTELFCVARNLIFVCIFINFNFWII